MQILSPCSRSAGSENMGLEPSHLCIDKFSGWWWGTLKLKNYCHKGSWRILDREIMRRYKREKMLKAIQQEIKLGKRTTELSCGFWWRTASLWLAREDARSPYALFHSSAAVPHWPKPIGKEGHVPRYCKGHTTGWKMISKGKQPVITLTYWK